VQTICGEVHDFSADPTVTGQNRLFYEPVHFNAEAGRRVLEQIYPGTAGKLASAPTFDARNRLWGVFSFPR
jgi:hypothetical protein